MKKIVRRILSLAVAGVLAVSTAAVITAADTATALKTAALTEYSRLLLQTTPVSYAEGGQSRVVSGSNFTYFLSMVADGTQEASVTIDNVFTVYKLGENNKKSVVFGGLNTYGAGDLLLDAQENVYFISGASSWTYTGRDGKPETAIINAWRYNGQTGIATNARSYRQLTFSEGVGYEYKTSVIDNAAQRIYVFFVSEDGYLAAADFDMTAKTWNSLRCVKLQAPVDGLYAYTTGNGGVLLAAQLKEAADSYLLLSSADVIGGEVKQLVASDGSGHARDFETLGDAYLDVKGDFHMIVCDKETGAYSHTVYNKALEQLSSAALPLNGASAVRMEELPDGTAILLAIPADTENFPLLVYTAADAGLGGLTLASTLQTAATSALKPGSFQISSRKSGSSVRNPISCVYCSVKMIFSVISLEG